MMLEIAGMVKTACPGLLPVAPTVVCIRTTRPVFLVFGRDPRRPICVVHVGPAEALRRTSTVLSRLQQRVPDLVPQPIVLAPLDGDCHLLVLSGLDGTPWFRLAEKYRDPGAWVMLRHRAIEALGRLHAAIRAVPEWRACLRPGDALRDRLARCRDAGIALPAPIGRAAADAAVALDSAGDVAHFWQHGDFCLNNMLISPHALHIVDFDEFGSTAMPLHDEIGLALSLHHLETAAGLRDRQPRDEIAACTRAALETGVAGPGHLAGFVWHYLVFRIEQCGASPLRARTQASLMETALGFAHTPDAFLPCR